MKKLYLVTETFPFGTAEKTFILPELEELIKGYDVTIISHASEELLMDQKYRSVLDERVKVVNIDAKLQWYKRLWYGFRFFLDWDGIREFWLILMSGDRVFLRLYQSIGFYALAMENFRLMKKKKILEVEESSIYYTYWYFYYTYSIAKKRNVFPNMKLITRAHRFDLYEEGFRGRRQPFKEIMDPDVDRIFFIAEQGKRYYLDKYQVENEGKYILSRLGTNKYNIANTEVMKCEKGIRIVSCSSLIPIKRVERIVQALSLLDEPAEWIHFGTGICQREILRLAEELLKKKENITYEIRGYVSNDKIMAYYSCNYVDCFITTSSSEGIPVSIQEAMSFGIPVIATDVGGVSELIENNGILLSENPAKEEVAEAIRSISHASEEEIRQMRKNSEKLWEQRFDAKKNRRFFIEKLAEM